MNVVAAIRAGLAAPRDGGDLATWLALNKFCAEAAMLLALLPPGDDVVACARAVRAASDTERTYRWLLQVPDLCVSAPGETQLLLDRVAPEPSRCGDLARELLAAGWGSATERTPSQVLEHAWTRRLAGLATPDEPLALRQSAVASRVSPVFALRQEAYGFTHAVAFATDFGTRPLPPWVSRADLAASVAGLLLWQVGAADADLLAETLATAEMLGLGSSPEARLGWATLASLAPGLPFAVPGTVPAAQYHPALATAIAYAVRRSPVPGPAPGEDAAVRDAVEAVRLCRRGDWAAAARYDVPLLRADLLRYPGRALVDR